MGFQLQLADKTHKKPENFEYPERKSGKKARVSGFFGVWWVIKQCLDLLERSVGFAATKKLIYLVLKRKQ